MQDALLKLKLVSCFMLLFFIFTITAPLWFIPMAWSIALDIMDESSIIQA